MCDRVREWVPRCSTWFTQLPYHSSLIDSTITRRGRWMEWFCLMQWDRSILPDPRCTNTVDTMWVIGNGYVLDDPSHTHQAITIDHMTTYHNGHSDRLTTFLTSITILFVQVGCLGRNVYGPLATCFDTLGEKSDHQYLTCITRVRETRCKIIRQ